jgi:hypothetical protein
MSRTNLSGKVPDGARGRIKGGRGGMRGLNEMPCADSPLRVDVDLIDAVEKRDRAVSN